MGSTIKKVDDRRRGSRTANGSRRQRWLVQSGHDRAGVFLFFGVWTTLLGGYEL